MNKKQSGVDIDLGNRCSKIAYNWAKKTFDLRNPGTGNPLVNVDGGFANIMDYGGVKVGISSDGIGTKIELAERTGIYSTLGYDLIAMVADDLAASGMETVNLSNILDVDNLDVEIVDELMKGLSEAASFARITITGGEIAELGTRIGGYGNRMHFNWGATGVGILPAGQQIIDGRAINPGDIVISLKSRGFRSNGFSLIRKIMEEQFGSDWHKADYGEGKTWGEVLLTPCLIYTPLIADLIKAGHGIHGIAHITGGGLADNFSRILRDKNMGAEVNNLFEPLPVMKKVQELGNVPEEQAYLLWNMGNGMLIVIDNKEADTILDTINLKKYEAKICGQITNQPEIKYQTTGKDPQKLTYRYE